MPSGFLDPLRVVTLPHAGWSRMHPNLPTLLSYQIPLRFSAIFNRRRLACLQTRAWISVTASNWLQYRLPVTAMALAPGSQARSRAASIAGFDSSPTSIESPDPNADDHDRGGRRRPVKRACNECRQQKVSCDRTPTTFYPSADVSPVALSSHMTVAVGTRPAPHPTWRAGVNVNAKSKPQMPKCRCRRRSPLLMKFCSYDAMLYKSLFKHVPGANASPSSARSRTISSALARDREMPKWNEKSSNFVNRWHSNSLVYQMAICRMVIQACS